MIKAIQFLILTVLVISCNTDTVTKPKIIVATAASGQFAFDKLKEVFKENHQVDIEIILGSSGKLTTQIINGAPFDILVSANSAFPELLHKKNKTLVEPSIYGYGIPVIWSLDSLPKLSVISDFLQTEKVKRIAIANPKNAPYGTMAKRFLEDSHSYDSVQSKLVYGESISQVNEYVLNKSAQIGFTAKSIVTAKKLKGKGMYFSLPESYFIPQKIAIINNNEQNKEIKQEFVNFVLSKEGKDILSNFGYGFL